MHIFQYQSVTNFQPMYQVSDLPILSPLCVSLQGSSRLQRGLLYMDYLRHWSGGTHKPQVTRVPNMGHSSPLMFTSPTFLRFIGA
jgi:hypothetical protein